MPRFVLLEHDLSGAAPGVEGAGTRHWDLMIEVPGKDALGTWRLLGDPMEEVSVVAKPIGDHRRAYLDYEGPVSRGRGVVRRVDTGVAEWLERSETGMCVRLTGGLLRGRYVMAPGDGGWRFQRLGGDGDSERRPG
ncbi:hypothetical protein RAS1_28610 [Phycisphaerae bacterium RAS1]|nr:hypothetical protein RAS1_28610 [Phycisphaerae bacterium RAS1]